MTRDLTSSVDSEVTKQVVEPFLLAELMFKNDPVYVWSGVGTLSWNGNDYRGVGDLGDINPIGETTDLKAEGLAFSLSGVPASTISLALSTNYQGEIARLRMGFFDGNGIDTANIISDPVVISEGLMDQLDINEQGDTSEVTVKAESRLIDLQRAREWLYDDESQKSLYSGDDGFEYVPSLQNKAVTWGVGTGSPDAPAEIHIKPAMRGGPTGPGSPGGGPGGPGAGGP